MLEGPRGLVVAGVVLLALVGVFFTLILAEDDPPAEAEDLPAGCQPGEPHVMCTYTSSTRLSVDEMVRLLRATYGNDKVTSSTPVWIQAWGGRGAKGASAGDVDTAGGFGGYAGYAMTISSVATLTGKQLYLYVGANGSKHANYSGQGGGSTIVSTQAISQIRNFPGPLLVLAGGSGGGGASCGSTYAGRGGAGGVVYPGQLTVGGGKGTGYTPGEGGSDGTGGASGGGASDPGADGFGGYGGAGNSKGSSVGWVNVDAVDPAASGWNTGTGGEGGGGGGGGGHGGGGGGGACVTKGKLTLRGGGGGGGSYAYPATTSDLNAPATSQQGDGQSSKVVLTFNLSPG